MRLPDRTWGKATTCERCCRCCRRYSNLSFPLLTSTETFPIFQASNRTARQERGLVSPSQRMASSSATSGVRSSILSSTNPTITEHDFRFPRRPGDAHPGPPPPSSRAVNVDGNAADSPSTNSKASAGEIRANLQDLRLDLSTTYDTADAGPAGEGFLRSAIFPAFDDSMASADPSLSPEEMEKQDPLATQVWKFFSKTRRQLPNQERMENITWRMMHVKLRKQWQEEQDRYVSRGPAPPPPPSPPPDVLSDA